MTHEQIDTLRRRQREDRERVEETARKLAGERVAEPSRNAPTNDYQEHCWHPTGTTLGRNPVTNFETCCHCGAKRYEVRKQDPAHGRYVNVKTIVTGWMEEDGRPFGSALDRMFCNPGGMPGPAKVEAQTVPPDGAKEPPTAEQVLAAAEEALRAGNVLYGWGTPGMRLKAGPPVPGKPVAGSVRVVFEVAPGRFVTPAQVGLEGMVMSFQDQLECQPPANFIVAAPTLDNEGRKPDWVAKLPEPLVNRTPPPFDLKGLPLPIKPSEWTAKAAATIATAHDPVPDAVVTTHSPDCGTKYRGCAPYCPKDRAERTASSQGEGGGV